MTVPNPWSKHYQRVWHEHAGDDRLPYWLRVASLAYGNHRANGHASFDAGQISLVLATVDSATGEVRPLDKGSLQRAIRKAVEFGWLSEQSNARCLVVPGHAIGGGVLGVVTEVCPQHRGRHHTPTQSGKGGRLAPTG